MQAEQRMQTPVWSILTK